MKLIDRVVQSLNVLTGKNSMSLPSSFLKYGNRRGVMTPEWTEVIMDDRDHYKGYGYASIKNRANKVSSIAINNVTTKSEKNDYVHPYLQLVNQSTNFTQYVFWRDISTYLDLEGIYYLMALRNKEGERVGQVQQFKLLNPYNIRRVITQDKEKGEILGGYVETRGGLVREIPPHMIIEIRELNPFGDDAYAVTDAAKASQFTLQTANDYSRHSLKNNINAPGILSTAVELDEEQFNSFISRVKDHKKGEPIFGNGKGAVDYKDMQTDLTKSALKEVNEVNRDELFATLGVSKTILGIEQSGVTRETSRVQKELNIEDHVLPRIQLIIDALNFDYETMDSRYKTDKAEIIVENPNLQDTEEDLKEIDLKDKKFDLLQKLVNAGIDPKTAGEFVEGTTAVDALKVKPVEAVKENNVKKKSSNSVKSNEIAFQIGALQNAVINVEAQLVAVALNRVNLITNSLSDFIPRQERDSAFNELMAVLVAFYGTIIAFQGRDQMQTRIEEYDMLGVFTMNSFVNNYINRMGRKVARSHVKTISNELYDVARKASIQGKSVAEIQSTLSTLFGTTISKQRAELIAMNETQRATIQSQLMADKQFISQNRLQKRAFKRLVTNSDNPCSVCLDLEGRGWIPFDESFAKVGDTLHADNISLEISFEDIEGGNVHPRCQCTYDLEIR